MHQPLSWAAGALPAGPWQTGTPSGSSVALLMNWTDRFCNFSSYIFSFANSFVANHRINQKALLSQSYFQHRQALVAQTTSLFVPWPPQNSCLRDPALHSPRVDGPRQSLLPAAPPRTLR